MPKKILLLCVSAILMVSCQRTLPPSFIVLKGATNEKYFHTGGVDRMLYKIETKFPAESTIQEITSKLESNGWQPLKEEFLHPGIATSLVTGWSYYEDPPKRPAEVIYEWSANWKDKGNNIVSYAFQYKDSIDKFRHGTVILKPASSTMIVNAVYMPNKIAHHMRESINRKKKKP